MTKSDRSSRAMKKVRALSSPVAMTAFHDGFWHKCEVPTASSNDRVRRQSGKHPLGMNISHFDPTRTSIQPGTT
jgi:hypothetical protein